MVVDNFHVMRVPISEAKAHTPPAVDVDRPLAFSIALERMQTDALQHSDLIETACSIDSGEPIKRLFDVET